MQRSLIQFTGFFFGLVLINLQSSFAITRSWDGGGTNDNWSLTNNWSPNGDPESDDLLIGDILPGFNAATIVNFDYSVNSLAVDNGASVDTDGNRLIVNGATSLATGSGATLRLRERVGGGLFPQSLDTNTLFVGTGATVEMHDNAVLQVDNGVFNLFGTLQGNGELQLDDIVGSPTSLFNNSGTLSVGVPGFSLSPPARTLRITRNTPNARLDLDGNGSGIVTLQQNATLDVDVEVIEPFSGVMNLAPNTTVDMADAWAIDGEVNVNTSNFNLVAPTTITGGVLSLNSGAVVTLDEIDEELHFAATLAANNGSTLANSGTVVFDAPAQFGATAAFNLIGTHGSMVVNSQSVTILQDSFDIDGGGLETNQVTVNAGAQLIFNGGNFGGGVNDLKADGVININGGEVIMDPLGNWTMDGTLNMTGTASNTATLRINSGVTTSSQVFIGDGSGASDANIVVSGDGESVISYRVIHFLSDADVDIAAGAVLSVGALAIYEGENATYDGEGTLNPGIMSVSENTTLNIAVVDLDHSVTPGGISGHNISAPLTINANSIDSDGDGFDGKLIVNFDALGETGRLNVNVPGGWQFDSGTITLDTGGSNGIFMLNGSAIDLGVEGGTLVAIGGPRTTAGVTIYGTVSVPSSGDEFILNGFVNGGPNRIAGGTVSGDGELQLFGRSLHGFGTISSDLGTFGASTIDEVVMADDGMLTISGDINGLDVLGVTDDGVLNVTNDWNTNAASAMVLLEGGEITGATITHNNNLFGGIRGNGLISARLINNESILAEDGGTLILDPTTGVNDYDGTTNDGQLRALSADLVLRNDNLATAQTFDSMIGVSSGQEVFVDGFRLDFSSSARLSMSGGDYRFNSGATFGGTVDINGPNPSRIVNEGSLALLFAGTSNITLNANLQLENSLTGILTGATFTGLGSLVNLESSELRLQDGATVAVSIINEGVFDAGTTGASIPAALTVGGLTQTSTGEIEVNISGVAPGTFDLLTVTNNAILDGILDVDLFNDFEPILGNSFTILETIFGNVAGTFSVEDLPVFNGLTFDVIYNSQSVVLEVIEASADTEPDGDVDGADFLAIQRTNPMLIPLWESQFGSEVPELAASQIVPEPSTLMMLFVTSLIRLVGRRQFAAS